ncbi:MAG: cytochrome c [Bacteroidia bacterium]|nr:cytochrome c [Bacteroidia bacterium]
MTSRIIAGITLSALALLSCNTNTEKNKATANASWSGEVATIIYKNCTPCHRPGESGPFNLMSYSDALKKSKLIRFVTQTKYMPPWPADNTYSHFANERVLTANEIECIKNWVDNGTPRGDSLTEPEAPVFYTGSYFGKPDLSIRLKEAVKIKGNGNDAFLILKYPYQIEKDTVIDFVEFVPAQRKLVHHVNGHLVSYDEKREFNYQSGSNTNTDTKAQLMMVYDSMHIPYTDKLQPHFPTLTPNTVYYLPGYIPPAYPKEVGGYRFKKNGLFLLNNIHYGPSNKDALDSSYINVFFRKSKIERPVTETQMGTFGISKIEPDFVIPPNEVKTFHTQTTLPYNISMLSVNPHMHLIGKSFWAFAIKQNGDTIPLIKINKWDFRWQYYYTFLHPVKLEAGTTIHVYGTFDNTIKNPNNPFHPPQSITHGNGVESMKTTEEMFQFIFTYMPYRPGDENILLERLDENSRR